MPITENIAGTRKCQRNNNSPTPDLFKASLPPLINLSNLTIRKPHDPAYDWEKLARPEQLPPAGDWHAWLILAGRGFGKTRTGAETIRAWVNSGKCRRIALISETEADVRKVMVEGISGILNVCPPHERPKYIPSKNKLVWPNGAEAHIFSGDRYDSLRGPQFDGAWVDELAKFRYPQEAWDQLSFALRLGDKPQVIITTTPRPIDLIQEMINDPNVVVTRGSTFDNSANLSPTFLSNNKKRYDGTRLGAQELYGEMLNQTDGALWTHEQLDRLHLKAPPQMQRIVVAIDPATTNHSGSDETGIVAVGLGHDGRCYVLEDLSGKMPPGEWARQAVACFHRWKADRIVAEINKGGDLVERIIRSIDTTISFKAVRATRGKFTRAEPVAALYEQGMVSHVDRGLETLENQMCTYVAGISSKSPDRLDALVWAVTELVLEKQGMVTPKAYLM
jgi:predicted phage terminase large subunit-like protein